MKGLVLRIGILFQTAWQEWRQAWRDIRGDSRRGETINVPLEEYCVLLEAANREARALELLGEAQEKIRELRALKQDAFY
jgi:hypothetical protein